MLSPVSEALDRFIEKYKQHQKMPPKIEYNSAWPSLCYLNTANDGDETGWWPVKQNPASDMFKRLAIALEEDIHPDIEHFYTRYWSDPLPATCPEGDLSLLQVWNTQDIERLRENFIGHALSKRQQKRPLTFFIACAEPDDEHFISVDNYSGAVWLELPGKPPIRKLADTLADFINTLEPHAW